MTKLEESNFEKLANKALEYIDAIIGPPLEEIGGILADRIRLWRYKNQIGILIKAREYNDRKGISPKTIPVKTLANLIEASSYEENESLKERWSALLANATDPTNNFSLHNAFIDVLKQLSPLEVEVLDFMWSEGTTHNGKHYIRTYSRYLLHEMHLRKKNTKKSLYGEMEKSLEPLLVENLIRLNLIEYEKPEIYNRNEVYSLGEKPEYSIRSKQNVLLTNLGLKLIEECTFR
jgi:hypothetical protein